MSETESKDSAPSPRRPLRLSLAFQLLLLVAVFIVVPLVVYNELRSADDQKRALVLASVQRQGTLVAQALQPLLAQAGPSSLPVLSREVQRFASNDAQVRILLAPTGGAAAGSFYYVAAAPEPSPGALDAEREQLKRVGVLDRLGEACSGGLPSALRFRAPDGREDVVTSVTPILGGAGCWAVVVTHDYAGSTGAILGRPFWETREIRFAALTYALMALIILIIFLSLWVTLVRFAKQAREIAEHGPTAVSFRDYNLVPELSGIAREFDRMVDRLRASAAAIRRAAEDNLHAFKTPIAVIRQSVDHLGRLVTPDNERGRKAFQLIEQSLDRLDALVVQSKRLDEATADLIDAPLGDLDVSATLDRLLSGYHEVIRQRGLVLETRLERGLVAHASAELFETAIENIIDNAIDFSPAGAKIAVRLSRHADDAEVTITDEGPGIDPADRARVFERYYSTRSLSGERAEEAHFGLGLSIVRRNVEVMGGTVGVENSVPRGLRVAVRLPLAQAA
ncbi:MAG: HAMP domain-containing histidine kinase [Alphaproteobacteria bacterium]|nr:HAMP domain-containing histidine kinase [Alphaproteobacteria bacterium]